MATPFILLWTIFNLSFRSTLANEKLENSERSNEKGFGVLNIVRLGISPAWLIDLEESYKAVFQNQFGLIKYRNLSTIPNHNIHSGGESWCQNVSFLSLEQNWRLITDYGYDSVLNSTIRGMLDNPRARLFEFEDHWGEPENYRFPKKAHMEICTNLIQLYRRVKSVFPFGKCIRLFQKKYCVGWSIAVYPGSPNSHNLDVPKDVRFQSIGPCLGNEFSAGYLNKTFPGFVMKNPELRSYIPDVIRMHNPDINLGSRKGFGNLEVQYVLGPGRRTQILKARPNTLKWSSHPRIKVPKINVDRSLDKKYGDVLGLAIPTNIGGPPNESFNVFAADPSALQEWTNVLASFYGKSNHIATFTLHFEYESDSKTRPLFFYYLIQYYPYYRGANIYGRIINGHGTQLRRNKPYGKVIPKYEYKVNAAINLTNVLKHYGEIFNTREFFSKENSKKFNSSMLKIESKFQYLISTVRITYNCKSSHYLKDQENITESTKLIDTIQGMIKNPMVRLFSGDNLTEYFEDYHTSKTTNSPKGCYNTKVLKKVQSAETFGKCIRLFESRNCRDLSLAIYGRRDKKILAINETLPEVRSLGPCLENEFIQASLGRKKRRRVIKNPNSSSFFPDLVQFTGISFNETYTSVKHSGQVNYVLGPKNRTLLINAYIGKIVIAQSPNISNLVEPEYDMPLGKTEENVLCFALPAALGGPANKSFNVFPTSQSKCDEWLRVFPTSFFEANEIVQCNVELNFMYENDIDSKPQYIFYYFNLMRDFKIYYGRFNNY